MTDVKIGEVYLFPLTKAYSQKEEGFCAVLVIAFPTSGGQVSVLRGDSKTDHEPWIVSIAPDEIQNSSLKESLFFPLSSQFLISSEFLGKKIGYLKHEKSAEILNKIILRQTEIYYQVVHKPLETSNFEPSTSQIPYAGRVFDEKEMLRLVSSSLDFWLTSGPFSEQFERAFAKKVGVSYCSLVNSGSSANLIAFMTLTSPTLEERCLRRGDEVITVAAGFPTTVSPIIQYGAVPIFVDVELGTYNIDCSQLEEALTEKTKAVMLAHTLGNPFNLDTISNFCKQHDLWLIEDNCDALGSIYKGRLTGSFGDIATSSFYPSHHITMGEGGAVYTNNSRLKMIIESFRDWGRDCYCPSGKDNTCKNRFNWELGTLPKGYDHKYIYSHFGYNLKATDLQASIGLAQLKKLDNFTELRKHNWHRLYNGLKAFSDYFILPQPTFGSNPSWFGFILTVKNEAGFKRQDVVQYLEKHNIQTRMLFAGNIIRHPCFNNMRKNKQGYRAVGDLENTDTIMNQTFWLGVYPGMTCEMLDFMIATIQEFIENHQLR